MTGWQRLRLARPVIGVYWLLILGGLVLFSAGCLQHVDRLAPLWLGAIVGTALGQILALRDARLWLTGVILIGLAYFSMPLMSRLGDGLALWQILVPAVLCGYWSLGDRALATAFWFPAVLWMLSILDRADGRADGHGQGRLVPDATGGALLVALALAFFLFLRLRESRRVGLWSAVAAQPLAAARPASIIHQPGAQQLLRGGWTLAITATTALITAWLAPRLWQLESLRGQPAGAASRSVEVGLACCPSSRVAELRRARVKEYLDLGIGRDDDRVQPGGEHGPACEICDDAEVAAARCDDCGKRPLGDQLAAIAALGQLGAPEGAGVPIDTAERDDDVGAGAGIAAGGAHLDGTVASPSATSELGAALPPPPVPPVVIVPAPAPPPAPVAATPAPLPAAPAPAHIASDRPATGPEAAGPVAHLAPPPPALWRWLAVLALAALVMQAVALALRPLRRLVLLRHLRDPLWPETIDQRISNAWQLALIGLGDAGWRPDASLAPRELAARSHIDGIERCAVILERARHGLGIDAADLSEMRTSAIAAYASARSRLGALARALTWLRPPLS
ncbi:MAG TPA: hypothetical protein VGC42_32260 [Kofleriaceae bacterium]